MSFKLVKIARSHKKKLIALVLTPLLIYYLKKKLTIGHFIYLVQRFCKVFVIFDYLPLPTLPKIRNANEYQHFTMSPIQQILKAMDVDRLRARIKFQQATWSELISSIFGGTTLTLTLYNIRTLYSLVHHKYLLDFTSLHSEQQFTLFIEAIEHRLIQQIPQLLGIVKQTLTEDLTLLDLRKMYSLEELKRIINNMTEKMFLSRYDMRDNVRHSSVGHRFRDFEAKIVAENILLSDKELQKEPQRNMAVKLLSNTTKAVLAGLRTILFSTWLPQPQLELTPVRYDLPRIYYLPSLKKANPQLVWPNPASSHLATLLLQQLQYLLQSINFNVLLREYAQTQQTILITRLTLYFHNQNKHEIQLSALLPVLYKILKQQFLDDYVLEKLQNFHSGQIRRAIAQKASERGERERGEGVSVCVLEQVEKYKAFQYLEKQFELKYFHERSQIIVEPRKGKENKKEMSQVTSVLEMLNRAQLDDAK